MNLPATQHQDDQQPTRQAIAAVGRSAPLKVSGKLKVALDSMVWNAMTRKEAAEHAALKEQSLYVALTKPHVKAYYLTQLEVLRTSERARNIHTLAEVRDQKSNQMARVQAVKVLEQISDDQQDRRPAAPFGGITVQIINSTHAPEAPKQAQVIDNVESDG